MNYASELAAAASYRLTMGLSPGVGGTHVIYVLHDAKNPEIYGGLPKDPHVPITVRLWKGPLKRIGNLAMVGGLVGLAWHYMRYGPKKEENGNLH